MNYDSDDEGMKNRCFSDFVAKDYIPDYSQEPQDAEEYIRRVNYEAMKIDNVMTSDIRPNEYQMNITFELNLGMQQISFDEKDAPNPEWVEHFLVYFHDFREKVDLIRSQANVSQYNLQVRKFKKDVAKWRMFCYEDETNPCLPELTKLLQLDYVHTNKLFHFMVQWIQADSKFRLVESTWLFSLLSLLQDPIQTETHSDMTNLVQHLFSSFSKFNSESKIEATIILTILLSYFHVMD